MLAIILVLIVTLCTPGTRGTYARSCWTCT